MRKTRYNKRKPSKSKRPKNRATQTIKKFIKLCCDIITEMKKIRINHKAFYSLIHNLNSKTVEKGGVLLGPVGSNSITHFYYDQGGTSTANSYSPDYITLNRKLRQQWRPAGLEIKGIAHSHLGNLDRLTYDDLSYIKRLMSRNPAMGMFVAPIVLPYQKSVQPMVISRDRMDYEQKAYFELF